MSRRNAKPRAVYFIRPKGMIGPIKIGCSCSPEGRRSALDTWSPFTLEIIAEIPGGLEIERRFHALFWDYHDRREWFRWCPLFDEVVAAINAGKFDVDSLPPARHLSQGSARKRTPAQCRQLSLSLRATHMSSRSGYESPIYTGNLVARGDEDGIALVEKYLADPATYGRAIDAPWAREKRAEFAKSRQRAA